MLCNIFVELRPDLEITRHVFRNVPAYVLHDPLTFQSHRFSGADYEILCSLRIKHTLGEVFASLLERDQLEQKDKERFYGFVYSLHKLGFLKLPIADDKSLYKRHVARVRAKRAQLLSSILFCRIPLINPDRMLTATMHYFRALFTRTAFIIWCLLLSTALWVVVRNWSEFTAPLMDIFTGSNLPLLWTTLILLKITHEFGHAYACKNFGGHVPEMGVFLILFTPCAYMDATASWGFTRKRDRIIVCLAGMYVELAIAAVAMVLWAITPPGLVQSLLHNVIILSSVVTIAFNLNPLMRYDGYYVVSDLVEVPNLRQRSYDHCTRVLKRLALRIDDGVVPPGRGHRVFLLVFGVSSAIYKVLLVLAISVLIATKILAVGVLVGGSYLVGEIVKLFRRVVPFLFLSEEVSNVRARAAFFGLVLMVGMPFAVMAIPVPSQIMVPGVIANESERILRSDATGFLEAVRVIPGAAVEAGQAVAVLSDPGAEVLIRKIEATLDAANVLHQLNRLNNPAEAKKEVERLEHLERERDFRVRQFEKLAVRSDVDGIVVDCTPVDGLGRFVRRGEPLATIVSGRTVVRALLTAEDMASAMPAAGQKVEFRTEAAPGRVVHGTIRRIGSAGTRNPDATFRDHLEMARFSIDPSTGLTSRHLFEIEVILEEMPEGQLLRGMTGTLRLIGMSEPVGKTLLRKALIFVGRISD